MYTFGGSRAGREDRDDLLRRIDTRVRRRRAMGGWLVEEAERPWLGLETADGTTRIAQKMDCHSLPRLMLDA